MTYIPKNPRLRALTGFNRKAFEILWAELEQVYFTKADKKEKPRSGELPEKSL